MRAKHSPGGLVVLTLMIHLTACGGGGGGSSGSAGAESGSSTQTVEIVAVGTPFIYTPKSGDMAGGGLTYSISNKPSWATFDPATGRLEGTPPAGSEGLYRNVTIKADDGFNATSVALTIEVVLQGDASIRFSWTAPLENEDGSVLTDLAGYMIYYGKSPRNYDSFVRIRSTGLTTYVLEGLTPGTYYVVATAFNSDGVESRFSNEIARIAR